MLAKLKSRKFWVVVAIVAIGTAMFFGIDSETIIKIINAVGVIIAGVTYIITEGKIDAAAVSKMAEMKKAIDETVECVKDDISDGK